LRGGDFSRHRRRLKPPPHSIDALCQSSEQ
jgi:hypothetical protein